MTGPSNLNLVRSIYADWEHGDYSSVGWADPEIEYMQVSDLVPEAVSYKGLAGMAEGARIGIDVLENMRIEPEDYRELDAERMLVVDRRIGRAKGSGLHIGAQVPPALGAHLFHIRNGRVTKLAAYFDRDRAYADLGLSPDSAQ